jgi:hypothetical protein
VAWSGAAAHPSLVGVVAFFLDRWGRYCYSGEFLSEDNDSGRQEKGTLSVTAESHG